MPYPKKNLKLHDSLQTVALMGHTSKGNPGNGQVIDPAIAATSRSMSSGYPRSGATPDAMAMAMDNGSATMATVSPAIASARRSASP